MALKLTKWDGSEYLHDDADIAAYIEAALEDGDPAVIALALGDVARAKGMTQIAREAGISREALYRALSETGDPKLTTLVGVMKALKIRLSVVPLAS